MQRKLKGAIGDSPERIKMCLNCKRAKCTNCFDHRYRNAGIYVDKKTMEFRLAFVEAYINSDSDDDIGKMLGKSQSTACKYRKSLGLPPSRKLSKEKKLELINQWKREWGLADGV